MSDLFLCALRELRRRPLRALAAGGGYFCAGAFLAAMVLFLGFELNAKSSTLNYMGTHFLAFSPHKYADGRFEKQEKAPVDPVNEAFFAEPMVVTRLLPKKISKEIENLPEVLAATPFLLFRFKQGQDGHIFSVGGLNAADKAALKGTATTERDIISGVFFKPEDRRVVLLDEGYALMWNLKTGSVVNIAGALYPVIGIVRPGVRPVRADIYMNWVDAEEAINRRLTAPLKDEANIFLVESNGLHNHAAALKKVESLFPDGIINTFSCSLPAIEFMGISETAFRLSAVLVVLLVSLFAGGSQWAAVSERRYEIAILKAIGWTDIAVSGQIMLESLLVAITGGFAGTLTGAAAFIALAPYLSKTITPEFSADMLIIIVVATAISTIVGAFAGLLPAINAARTRPAEALRSQ